MKTLLLIPSALKVGLDAEVAADRHPTMDYYALAEALRSDDGAQVELLDYTAVDNERHPLVRLVRRVAGRDAALALMAFLRCRTLDAIFTNGENLGIPLALLLKLRRRRPRHVMIGHRLSAPKKRAFFTVLRAHRQIDTIFTYASAQSRFGREQLGIPAEKLAVIPFHADACFYRPLPSVVTDESLVCSAGREWRDYPTLFDAIESMPEMQLRLTGTSPWSKHRNSADQRALPANVRMQRYEYDELRVLYAQAGFIAVPLEENDFAAGITTVLEGMAMGKPVVVTRTAGQTDVVVDGENGLTVAPGDAEGWREVTRRLRSDAGLRERLGRQARLWIERHATLDHWVQRVAGALRAAAPGTSAVAGTGRVGLLPPAVTADERAR